MVSGEVQANEVLWDVLACPRCRASLEPLGETVPCTACPFVGQIRDGVAVLGDPAGTSFFDERYQAMRAGHIRGNSEWQLCYEQQLASIRRYLAPGTRALDVGCGPDILYERDRGCFLIGLDASRPTIRVNTAADLRIHADATAMPLTDQSVDVVICLYAFHHMVASTVRETVARGRAVFKEFHRVLRPGGDLFVCEMNPWRPAAAVQDLFWNLARRVLGARLDQYFWTRAALEDLGGKCLPGATLRVTTARVAPMVLIPPVFTAPWLKMPRFLFPLEANLYHWQSPRE